MESSPLGSVLRTRENKINVHVFTNHPMIMSLLDTRDWQASVRWREMHIELFISLTELLLWWICACYFWTCSSLFFALILPSNRMRKKEEDRQKWIMILSKRKYIFSIANSATGIQCYKHTIITINRYENRSTAIDYVFRL